MNVDVINLDRGCQTRETHFTKVTISPLHLHQGHQPVKGHPFSGQVATGRNIRCHHGFLCAFHLLAGTDQCAFCHHIATTFLHVSLQKMWADKGKTSLPSGWRERRRCRQPTRKVGAARPMHGGGSPGGVDSPTAYEERVIVQSPR